MPGARACVPSLEHWPGWMPVYFCFHWPLEALILSATAVACPHAPGRRTPLTSCTALRGGWSLITQCPASCPHPPPLRPASLVPPSPLAGSAHQLPLPIPRVPGWGGGEAGTAPRPHGRPSEPEAEGAPGGAGHRPAGPAGAELGPGAGLPWPPAGRGQPGELGNAVCPGEALSIVLSGYLRSRKCREADGGRVGRGPGDRRRGGG